MSSSGVLDWWEAHFPALLRNARRWTHDHDEAEDVVAEAVLRAWLAERRGQAVDVSYAYHAVRTICVDLARRAAVQQRYLDQMARILPAAAPAADAGLLLDALDGLTPRQREVVARMLVGERLKETSADLGVTEATVRQTRRRAVAKLRQQERQTS